MKRNIILGIFLCLLSTAAQAQMKAKLTNRFIVKTDLMHCFVTGAYNAELETYIGKRFSISIGYINSSKLYKQTYRGYQFPGWDRSWAFENKTLTLNTKGLINSQLITLQLRHYHGKLMQSPLGGYSFILAGIGNANLQGDYTPYLFDPDMNFSFSNYQEFEKNTPLVNYTAMNRLIIKGAIGEGMQFLLSRHIVLDLSGALEYDVFQTFGASDRKVISGLTRHYGPTLVSLNTMNNANSFGISAFVKLGYLIY